MDSESRTVETGNISRQDLLGEFSPLDVINRLPTEILALIFTYVRDSSHSSGSRRAPTFPFNVASTCPFWMDILKSNPANWKSISIDVVDPTPLLDTLTMFTGGAIKVFVFSSIKEAASIGSKSKHLVEDVQKCDENLQVQIILRQLEPLIKRCTSITFDLIFQSSLPCTTSILARSLPYLEKLILKCLRYDVDDNEGMVEIDVDYSSLEFEFKIPLLKKISLPGYSFLQLGQLDQAYLLMIAGQKRLSLSIDQLTLQKKGNGTHNNTRTFTKFIDAIEDLDCSSLTLSNVAFDYRPKPRNRRYTFGGENLTLDNVSPEFISAFFASFAMDDLSVLQFSRCLIPFIAEPILDSTLHSHLILEDIPFPLAPSVLPTPWSANHFPDSSLYNAIKLFAFSHLFLVNCEGVRDDFFEWLSGEDDYVPAEDLKALLLENCSGFTSGALRKFITTRQATGRPLIAIEVIGKGPMISRNDLAWFLDESQTTTHVNWNVEADASMGQDFVADLRPVGEDKRHEDAMYIPLFDF